MTLQEIERQIANWTEKAEWFQMFDEQERWSNCKKHIDDLNCLAAATIESQAVSDDFQRTTSPQ